MQKAYGEEKSGLELKKEDFLVDVSQHNIEKIATKENEDTEEEEEERVRLSEHSPSPPAPAAAESGSEVLSPCPGKPVRKDSVKRSSSASAVGATPVKAKPLCRASSASFSDTPSSALALPRKLTPADRAMSPARPSPATSASNFAEVCGEHVDALTGTHFPCFRCFD